MATLDDSPSLYLGQQWTHWAEKVDGKSQNDVPSSKEPESFKDDGDTIKLRHQDMSLYGLCPARDEFYLVVCECCEQVVKPQALKRHIEQRHGNISPRPTGIRKTKGSPGRHTGSPGRHSGSPARHTVSPGRRSSPKRDTQGKSQSANAAGIKSSKSSGSSHRSSSGNGKSKKPNHSLPVVKVERMESSLVSGSSPSRKISSNSKHDSDHRDHKHERDHRDHKDHHHKHDKEHKDHKDHHKDHRDHKDRDHREKDSKDKDYHKEYKDREHREKEYVREKEHGKERKEKEYHKHEKEKDYGREKDREKDHRDHKDHSRDRESKEKHDKDHSDKDHKERDRDHKDHREKDHKEKDHKDHHKDHSKHEREHREHKEKKSSSSAHQNSNAATTVAQTTSSVTPPRPGSLSKTPTLSSPSANANSSSSTSNGPAKLVREKMLPCKDREFDANKHCGVWNPDTLKPCTRSLTCKTHALSLRRAVLGRRKPFDDLLKEHRAAKEAFLKAKAEEKEAAAAAKAAASGSATSQSTSSKSASQSSSSQNRESSKESSQSSGSSSKGSATSGKSASSSTQASAKSAKQAPVKVTSPPPRHPPPPPTLRDDSLQGLDTSGSRLSSDNEDDEDDKDKLGYPQLSFHPRPAVVNTFGGRCYSGTSLVVFNRRSDLLRAAFHACVERHLHPPPHKKLCVESKLPEGSHIATNSQDPYEFPAMEANALASSLPLMALGSPPLTSPTSTQNSLNSSWNTNKLANRVKPKSSLSRNIKPKDSSSATKNSSVAPSSVAMVIGNTVPTAVTSNNRTSSMPASNSSLSNNSGGGVKRKRSGSGSGGLTTHHLPPGLTVNHSSTTSTTGNPISIAIPSASLNLANLTQSQLNSINATIAKAGGQHVNSGQPNLTASSSSKNHLLKDSVNIVVTSMDPSLMNGQLVTTAMPSSTIADITHLQLNSLGGGGDATNSQVHLQTHKSKKEKKQKTSHSSSNSSHDGVSATLTSLASGVVVMPDLTGQQTFSQTFGSSGLLTSPSDLSSSKLSPSTTSAFFASGSASPHMSGSSPLANGMLGPGMELKVKSLPVNHVAGAMMVSPNSSSSSPSPSRTNTSGQLLADSHNITTTHHSVHQRSSSKGNRTESRKTSGSRSKSHSVKSQQMTQVAASQQLPTAAITLTPQGNRLLSTTALPTMYTMEPTSGQFQHIQIQPKVGGKQTLATGMSIIPMATVTSAQQQAHATLLLQNDDHQRELSGAHHAAAAQLQSSPSNVLS